MLSQSHGQQSLQSRKPKPSLNGQNFRQKVSAPLAQKHLAPSSRPKVAAYNDFSLVYSCSQFNLGQNYQDANPIQNLDLQLRISAVQEYAFESSLCLQPSSAVHNDHGKGKTRRLVKRKSKEDGCDEEEVDYKSIIRGMFKYGCFLSNLLNNLLVFSLVINGFWSSCAVVQLQSCKIRWQR